MDSFNPHILCFVSSKHLTFKQCLPSFKSEYRISCFLPYLILCYICIQSLSPILSLLTFFSMLISVSLMHLYLKWSLRLALNILYLMSHNFSLDCHCFQYSYWWSTVLSSGEKEKWMGSVTVWFLCFLLCVLCSILCENHRSLYTLFLT